MRAAPLLALALGLTACPPDVFPAATGGASAGGGGAALGGGGAPSIGGAGGAGGLEPLDCSDLDDECGVGIVEDGACVRAPRGDGTPCDDGLACTTGDRCEAGVCLPIAPFECAVQVQCHVATCDGSTGLCELVPSHEGELCDDADACTTQETCSAGVCGGGTPLPIPEDEYFCQKIVCDPRQGFVVEPDNLGEICAAPDACAEFRCADNGYYTQCLGFPRNEGLACDDGRPCTEGDVCVESSCVGTPVVDGSPCDDGISCTTGDWCLEGYCEMGAAACAPSTETCVYRACETNPSIGTCLDYPDWGVPCEDPSPCRGEGSCEVGLCKYGPPTNEGAACDDRRACTTQETCAAGACEGVAITACVGGDGCCPAGCSAPGDSDCGAVLYMASTQGLAGFFAFDLDTEVWIPLAEPPSPPRSRLTTREGLVFVLGEDGGLYQFDPSAASWSLTMPGPTWMVGPPHEGGEGLAALPEGFLLHRGEYLYRSNGSAWMALTSLGSDWSSAWAEDPVTGDVLIRHGWGFVVLRFEVSTNSLGSWADGLGFGGAMSSRFGSLWNGDFYTATAGPAPEIVAIPPGVNSVPTHTGLFTADENPSSDLDPATDLIYLGPSDSAGAFEVFDPLLMTLSPLPSPPPIPDGYLSSVVVVRAPSAP
jgi:hypothetical protein